MGSGGMIVRALGTLAGCVVLLAGLGGAVGYWLGKIAPGYYRGVFRGGQEPGFDPVSVGLGLGLTQGFAGGVVVGLALVAILSWREVRLRRGGGDVVVDGTAPGRGWRTARRLMLIAGGLVAIVIFSAGAYWVGAIAGQRGAYHRRYLEERSALAPVIAGDPAFSAVEIDERSRGGVDLGGRVASEADLERLREGVIRAVGEKRARELISGVWVERERL